MDSISEMRMVVRLEEDLWRRLYTMFKLFQILPSKTPISIKDYANVFGLSFNLFIVFYKMEYPRILANSKSDPKNFDQLLEAIYSTLPFRRLYAKFALRSFRLALEILERNKKFKTQMLDLFQRDHFDFLEIIKLPSIL